MPKMTMTPVKVYRITVYTPHGKTSKRCSTPAIAAEHVAIHRTAAWWKEKGCKWPTNPQRYQRMRDYHEKLERRVLKIFEANW